MIKPEQLRREADFALKDLRSPDEARALAAAQRFTRVPALALYSPEELRRRAAGVKRKHALDLTAIEHQLGSWSQVLSTAGRLTEEPSAQSPESSRPARTSLLKPPKPEELARRVAERAQYFAEPLGAQSGGGHRLDVERVREEALAAILDALRGDEASDPKPTEVSQ